jgi:hypothetical protein
VWRLDKNRAAMVYTQELRIVFFANAQNLRHSSTSLAAPLGMPLARHGLALEFSNQRTLRHHEATEFRGFLHCWFGIFPRQLFSLQFSWSPPS